MSIIASRLFKFKMDLISNKIIAYKNTNIKYKINYGYNIKFTDFVFTFCDNTKDVEVYKNIINYLSESSFVKEVIFKKIFSVFFIYVKTKKNISIKLFKKNIENKFIIKINIQNISLIEFDKIFIRYKNFLFSDFFNLY